MTEPNARRPIEDRLEAALRAAARSAIPDQTPMPDYPRKLSERGRRQARRRWLVPVTGLAMAAAIALVAVAVVTHSSRSAPPVDHLSPSPEPTVSQSAASPVNLPPANAGTWSLISPGPVSIAPQVAWTGTEAIVNQGGCCADPGSMKLAAYNPASNSWRPLPQAPLSTRSGASKTWTGTEVVMAGGYATDPRTGFASNGVKDGAAWNPQTNTWHAIAPMPVAVAFKYSVWTGSEVLVWGSLVNEQDVAPGLVPQGKETVLAYNPTADSWRMLPSSGLSSRLGEVVVWTGHELIVWGGRSPGTTTSGIPGDVLADGARLDPVTGVWRRLAAAPVPGRSGAGAVWSGKEVLFWGGVANFDPDPNVEATYLGQGAAYNPDTNSWRALPASPLRAKAGPATVWTGRFFLVIGGTGAGRTFPIPGPGSAAYDPATDTWVALPSAPSYPDSAVYPPPIQADQRSGATAFWTGNEVIVLGGHGQYLQAANGDGLIWKPTPG